MDTVIRDAAVDDAGRILDIYSYYVKDTAISFEYEVPSLSEFKNRMIHTMERYPYIVIEADGKIQGYAYAGCLKDRAAYDKACETTIYLDRTAKKQGLGRKLYEALEARLKGIGILNLYACVAVPDTDDEYLDRNSLYFHEHMGFSKAGEFYRCGYKFDRWYNMVWMEKIIGIHEQAQ